MDLLFIFCLAFAGFYQMYNTILIFPDAILTIFHLVKISSIFMYTQEHTYAGRSLSLWDRNIYNRLPTQIRFLFTPIIYKRSNEMIPLWFQFLCNIYTFLCEKWRRRRNKNNTLYEMYLEFIATNCKLPSTVTFTILTVTGYARLKKEVT